MITPEHAAIIFAILALMIACKSFVVRVYNTLQNAIDGLVTGIAALSFVAERGPGALLIRELSGLHKKLSDCLAFVAVSPVLPIVLFGVMALIPAPGTSPELTVQYPIFVGLCMALEFLLLGLLHVGAEKAMSAKFINPFTRVPHLPTKKISACGIYEVDPPRPRFFA